MPANWTTGSGNPADSLGSDGDLYRDYTNRIDWGPKGRISAGSWQGTAQSTVGSTGFAPLSLVGVPGAGFGLNGQSAVDASTGLTYFKSNNAWTQVGALPAGATGPMGQSGFTTLPNTTFVPGPTVAYNAVTASSTPLVVSAPGTTIAQTFNPPSSSAFLGMGYTNFGVAVVAELYDVTASKSIITISLAAGSYSSTPVYTSSQYPLIAGNQHVWRLTGSGSATGQLQPNYLLPSAIQTAAFSILQGWTTAPSTAFTSTALDVLAFGVGTKPRNVTAIRSMSVTGLTGVYQASTQGAAAASVTVSLGTYNPSGGAVTVFFTSTATLPNTGVPTTLGSFAVGQYTVPANVVLFMRVQGSGTGQVNCDVQVVQ